MTVALLGATGNLLSVLRWRGNTSGGASFYNDWDANSATLGTTNYWGLSNTLGKWSNTGIWAVAAVTSIMALAVPGFAGLNETVWIWAVGLGLLVIDALVQVFQWLGMRKLKT